jgi:tRNA pseudouridine55 synthase
MHMNHDEGQHEAQHEVSHNAMANARSHDEHAHKALSNVAGPSGFLLIDKPIGPTSMHVCANVRARLRRGGAPKRIKVGHAGTLDPMASGLLVVMVGKFTKHCNALMASTKVYDTTIDLSCSSDTDDAEGNVRTLALTGDIPPLAAVHAALATMVGHVMQVPPLFSALHVGGERAYDLARGGRGALLPARPVHIHAIDVLSYAFPLLTLRVTCGKGVYIRSIARDVGAALGGEAKGLGGMLRALRRTHAQPFDVAGASPLHSLPDVLLQRDLRTQLP